MPWCDSCDAYVKPENVTESGAHETCGETVDTADKAADLGNSSAPWHFKLMVTLLCLYLGWRLIEFGAWIIDQL